jgi:hypothetical protein
MPPTPPLSNPPKPEPSKAAVAKPITVTLAYGVRQYEVKAVTNTTILKPGMWLDEDYVKLLCDHPDWTVSVVDDQIIQQLIGVAIGGLPIPKI